jgi:phage tail-like protein
MTTISPGPLLSHLPAVYHSSDDLGELLAKLETIFFGPPALSKRDMTAVEEALQAKGYTPGEIDGVADDEAHAAIRAFQKDNGLPMTGMVDQKTADRLGVKIRSQPLEPHIARIATYFDAAETPDEFLPWLAGWVALSHKIGLLPKRQRELVGRIVPLYAQRGTKQYLAKLLEFFSPDGTEIIIEDHELAGFVIGTSEVGVDSWLERERVFWFRVRLRAPYPGAGAAPQAQPQNEWQERARQVIDLAKPAHTMYQLDWAWM